MAAFQPREGERDKKKDMSLPQRTFPEVAQDTSACISFARTYSYGHAKLEDMLREVVLIPNSYVSQCKFRERRRMNIGG